MRIRRICFKGVLVLSVVLAARHATAQPAALADPILESIKPGDIVVTAREFVRAPKTLDSDPQAGGTNTAWARIQSLQPLPDGSGRLAFNDTRGLIYLTDMAGSPPTVYLDLRKYGGFGFVDSMFPNETGLAGFAFHPDFAKAGSAGYGKFYTAYSARSDSGRADYLDDDAASHESVIREWTTTDPGAMSFSGASREVFRVGQFAPNHNIGTLAFNPNAAAESTDYGLLYACLGDGGAANDPRNFGQSLAAPHGAIIRIDPLGGDQNRGYGVPADNPFFGMADVAPEIWAYGLRHPQHFSWDKDGRMFIGDIGQNQIEEINLGVKGANYGWRLREGTFATAFAVPGTQAGAVFPLSSTSKESSTNKEPSTDEENAAFVYPIAQYDHDEGYAVSGGFVYRGAAIADLTGKYLFADMTLGRVLYIDADDIDTDTLPANRLALIQELRLIIDGAEQDLASVAGMPNTYAPGKRIDLRFGQDAEGELYLLSKSDGWIRKLVPAMRDY